MRRKHQASFSRESLQWLRHAVVRFLRSPVGGTAKLWIACLLLLMLCINGINVTNSYVLRDFMSAIETKDRSGFVYYAWVYFGVFAVSTVVTVFLRFAEERLGLLWRDWLTKRLTERYIDGKIYLHVQSGHPLTNPDQRISEDVKSLTVTTLSFVLMILNSTITVLSFSGVLWGISPTLFLVAVVYALAGSGLTVLLGKSLIRLNYRQADFEANFRSDLVRVRQAADGIALTGYEGRIRKHLMHRIDSLVHNFRRIIKVNRNLGFFTTGYNYLIQLIPTLIVAPLFILHDASFGIIGQSAMAFSTLVAALSLIVTQFQSISTYATVLARLGEFAEAASRTVERRDISCIDCSGVCDHFVFRDVTLYSATDESRVLIERLNVVFSQGTRVLIYGQDHAAKQALFRAAAGLHVVGSGSIDRPPPGKTVFLPENPFLPSGTLRDILVPAERDETINNQDIQDALREVGLDSVITRHDGFDVSRNWHDILSLKEEQLMAVARALLAQPDFAFLDQLDSALGHPMERQVLKLMARQGITCISLSNGLPNSKYHDAGLELRENGQWQWTDLTSRSS